MRQVACPHCDGARLNPLALAVTLDGLNVHDLSSMSISDAADRLSVMKLDDRQLLIAERVLKEINARLRFLVDVGLDYLNLHRGRPRCPGARPSASASPAKSVPAWSVCCTCWTNRRSACISATTIG